MVDGCGSRLPQRKAAISYAFTEWRVYLGALFAQRGIQGRTQLHTGSWRVLRTVPSAKCEKASGAGPAASSSGRRLAPSGWSPNRGRTTDSVFGNSATTSEREQLFPFWCYLRQPQHLLDADRAWRSSATVRGNSPRMFYTHTDKAWPRGSGRHSGLALLRGLKTWSPRWPKT